MGLVVRDQHEVVADDVDANGGEEEEDNEPELPVMVEAAPIGSVGLVGGLVGLVRGGGVWIVRLGFAHWGGAFRVAGLTHVFRVRRGYALDGCRASGDA